MTSLLESPELNIHNKKPLKRPSWEAYFLGIAQAVAARSPDAQTRVGVVIADQDHRILATGYNGFPPGLEDHLLPNLRPDKYRLIVHAELNAIASSRQDLRGATLFSTHSPCQECAKAIVTAGIKKVVFQTTYQNDDHEFVAQFLNTCAVPVHLWRPDCDHS